MKATGTIVFIVGALIAFSAAGYSIYLKYWMYGDALLTRMQELKIHLMPGIVALLGIFIMKIGQSIGKT